MPTVPLTVVIGDPLIPFKTGEGGGMEAADGLHWFVGKDTAGVASVAYLRNQDDENTFTFPNADQNGLITQATRP